MRVLVVEDESALAGVLQDFLADMGHQAILVRSAEAALGTLATERPDAILLDIHLPGMSGLDFLQLRPVRESGLPVVAVSGVATESQARECLRLGAVEFVGKPVSLERLTEVLAVLEPIALHRRQQAMAAQVDRRRGPRARADLPVRIAGYDGLAWEGRCVELGTLSMKARSSVPLALGTPVRLRFTPPDEPEALELMGLVARVERDVTVFAFVRLGEPESRRLSHAVHRLLQ
ncbi:MAG TPA: response regulator [Methylomirabilota bacterium]|nr:response regulator [Methylomirabilota bacterium]